MKKHLVICSALVAASAHGGNIERWFRDQATAPTGTPLLVGAIVSADKAPPKAHGSFWGAFPDATLQPGGSVTMSCTWKCDLPPGEKSSTQIRVALLGAPRDSANYRRDLRGFVLNGGFAGGGRWQTMLWERVADTPAPCVMSNTAILVSNIEREKSEPEQTMRIVFTVKKTAARTFDVSGFWGSHAFTFNGVKTANDLATFNCVGFLNGKFSGFDLMTIENCKVMSE